MVATPFNAAWFLFGYSPFYMTVLSPMRNPRRPPNQQELHASPKLFQDDK
jgi:hypothetical protein